MRRLIPPAVIALVALLLAGSAQAASLHVVFPQTAEVTVVRGSSTDFTLEVQAFGATRCSATTAPVRIDGLYMVDRTGAVHSGDPADMPISTDQTRGSSDNCDIHNPVEIPLTATAAPDTPVGDYSGVIRYGKGGDGGVDLDGPPLTVHVVAAPEAVLPPPALQPPPEIIVLGDREVPPRPTAGKTVMLTPVSGSPRFRAPGNAPVTLTKATIVPNGTAVDDNGGVVKVTVAHDKTPAGQLDSVDAWGGGFSVHQDSSKRPFTTLTLLGANAVGGKAATAAKTRGRKLWVNGKGNFKTSGKRASAEVRGTYWLTQETSAGTKVTVRTGLVAVRDFSRKRTVLVSTGHSYTARPVKARVVRLPVFTGSV